MRTFLIQSDENIKQKYYTNPENEQQQQQQQPSNKKQNNNFQPKQSKISWTMKWVRAKQINRENRIETLFRNNNTPQYDLYFYTFSLVDSNSNTVFHSSHSFLTETSESNRLFGACLKIRMWANLEPALSMLFLCTIFSIYVVYREVYV